MTAKEEILELMRQIPDGLTVAETIDRLRSIYGANDAVGKSEKSKTLGAKEALSNSAPPHLDSQTIKDEIIGITVRLPDDLTMAEAVCEATDHLRLFYLIQKDFEDIREGRALPFEERPDTVEFHDEVPEIGRISADALDRMTIKEKLTRTMKLLPDGLTLEQAVFEARERLLFFYKYEKASEQIRRGETYTLEEVRQQMSKWLA